MSIAGSHSLNRSASPNQIGKQDTTSEDSTTLANK